MKLGVSLLMCLVLLTGASAAVNNIPADTLIRWLNNGPAFDFLLIDVRDSATEVAPDSVIGNDSCRPYNLSWNQGVLLPALAVVPRSAHLVIYCRSGARSARASDSLDKAGYQSVYNVTGGFMNWRGPKVPARMARARSELPAPSMRARSLGAAVHARGERQPVSRRVSVLTASGPAWTSPGDHGILASGRKATQPALRSIVRR